MSKTKVLMTIPSLLFLLPMATQAQSLDRPGLWEMTTVTTPKEPPAQPATNTSQSCITQAMVDKKVGSTTPVPYGCGLHKVVHNPTSMSAELNCPGTSGLMVGKGTIESSWEEGKMVRGKIHFAGTHWTDFDQRSGMDAVAAPPPGVGGTGGGWYFERGKQVPLDITIEYSTVYKGPDCGNVKPQSSKK